ncbi:hypothetical protein VNO78_15712 [Psophocarpus tetragonolobus]|uniref:Uncharacterized protein n=1 Tax=Psophocarpus tetragonolobus TaxID=3891 RepID=A0AAN9SFV4_PSOTE
MSSMTSHVIAIKEMMEGAEAYVTKECCIYKVPSHIRRLNEDAYTPKVVSIGPFHHNTNPLLHSMERHKLIYCKAFLERTETNWDKWIHYIEEVQLEFRSCYSDTLEFSKEELVKIIFVDSGFILELFWRHHIDDESTDDIFLSKPWLDNAIRYDLLLLENQIPFFVLKSLFNLSFNCDNNDIPSFIELSFEYFSYFNGSNMICDNISSIRHFTDLIRTFHLHHPQKKRPARTGRLVNHLPSATELSEAGVKFKVDTQSSCLLDLRFSGGVLEIPQLKVEDWTTELLFRNMVALEQCHYPNESYITDYVLVLDFLINTSKDVDLLVRKRVLVSWLGDSESVALLFNGLWKNIVQTSFNSHYFQLCKDLNAWYRNPWRNLKATLRSDYCKSPWQTAASVAGIFLIVLTLIQTVCSILQVIHP